MKRTFKTSLLLLGTGAVVLQSGCSWVATMLGDAIGDFLVFNFFLD